jgi:regulatory protein
MHITGIEVMRGRRGRLQVYGDGVPLFQVSRRTVAKSGLRPGIEIDPARVMAILAEDARSEALRVAASALARRPHSERDLRRRLAQRRFAADVIDATIDRLKSVGLINDAEFAVAWVEARDRTSPRSRRLVTGELRAHGVAAELATEASTDVDDEEAAWRAVARRLPGLVHVDDDAARARLAGYLQRRGFAWSVVGPTIARALVHLGRPAGGSADVMEAG